MAKSRSVTLWFTSIWTTFCHHIHFFASLAEAAQWARGRDDIELLSVEQAFEFGKHV